jgi:uncharacterized protein YjbJ (UPF0337 family)
MDTSLLTRCGPKPYWQTRTGVDDNPSVCWRRLHDRSMFASDIARELKRRHGTTDSVSTDDTTGSVGQNERPANREECMADKSGPQEAVKGVVEGIKGKAKEAFGTVTGRGDVAAEGEAQQDKGQAQRDAARKEAEAEAARGAAKAAEKRQEQHQ